MSVEASTTTPPSYISRKLSSDQRSMNDQKQHPNGSVILSGGQPMLVSEHRNDPSMAEQIKLNGSGANPVALHPYRDHNGVRLQRLNPVLCHQGVPFSIGSVYDPEFIGHPPAYNGVVSPQMKQSGAQGLVKLEGYSPFSQKTNSGFYDPHVHYHSKVKGTTPIFASPSKERPGMIDFG